MNKFSPFQLALLGFFGFVAVAGLIVFAMFQVTGDKVTTLVVWSEINSNELRDALTKSVDPEEYKIVYQTIAPDKIDQTFVDRLSVNQVPDIVIMDSRRQFLHEPRLYTIPYQTFSQSRFQDRYISGANSVLTQNGMRGLPLFVDPIVMYWNEDQLSSAGLAQAPEYWDEVSTAAQRITKRSAQTVYAPAVALGEYQNIPTAKEILSAMFLQVGVPIIEYNSQADIYQPNLITRPGNTGSPGLSVLTYYTDFAQSGKAVYSWNRSFREADDEFVSNNLAVMFDYASTFDELQARNPNLLIRSSVFPQIRDGVGRTTFGRFYVAYLPVKSTKHAEAVTYLEKVFTPTTLQRVSKSLNMAPTHREAILSDSNREIERTAHHSALISKTWSDVDMKASSEAIQDMINDVLYRNINPSQALTNAQALIMKEFN